MIINMIIIIIIIITLTTGFFASLTPVVVANFGDFFPELKVRPQGLHGIIDETPNPKP